MILQLTINGQKHVLEYALSERLLDVLRRHGFFGVKHGCETGECGACAVLLDGVPVASCVMLAAQAEGRSVTTIESLGDRRALHPIQQAFAENGAIQCGFCTPAMVLAAHALLDANPHPTETEVRDALSGVLCRCTGYKKPVEAVLRAAMVMRGETPPPLDGSRLVAPEPVPWIEIPPSIGPEPGGPEGGGAWTVTRPAIRLVAAPEKPAPLNVVGQPEPKVDAARLVQGKPAFTADLEMRGMLVGKLLLSPVAHARIKRIDVSKARALPGVHAVLTYQDIPRVVYTTAGQSHPEPGPHDQFSLDKKVRFVGDRVAAVAAETEAIAQQALELIEVEYQQLPAVFDPKEAMGPKAPVIHDEPESWNIADKQRNLAGVIDFEVGNVEEGLKQADHVFEAEYTVQQVQQATIETHVCVTWWDENDRLVIRTSTQVPFHVRRILAPVLGLPAKRIRVIKPRIGGGFGGKQEILLEDICAHLTMATGRPVRMEYTRAEEFTASRSRHPMIIKMRTGVKADGTLVANEMTLLSNTGAYGTHALTVAGNTGHKSMALYKAPNIKFHADIVYTNLPVPGAFRGYGVPQGFFAVESHMEDIARKLGLDPLEFRLKNAVREGDEHPLSRMWSEGRAGHAEIIRSCGLAECAERGAAAFGWRTSSVGTAVQLPSPPTSSQQDWRTVPGKPYLRRGQGVALVMQGTAIPYLDMGAASIKLNDDGSFNVLVGATDLGTGSDTVLAQMAAEVLGCRLEDIIIYSSDTDFTPFDKGAYASSTTYISGAAVVQAAEQVADQIREVAGAMLGVPSADLVLRDRCVWAPDGRTVTLEAVALESLHHQDQRQIMAVASYVSPESPPPFAAQFAEVTVDTETGQVTVDRLLMAVDSGRIINPLTAAGQVEGGMAQALGYAVCEEMHYGPRGELLTTRFDDYKIFRADEMPELDTIFVETVEPSHPFGVKAVAEIPMDGVAPAVANAVLDAVGVRIRELPLTPEKVWWALRLNKGA